MVNTLLGFKFSIYQNNTKVYEEEHFVTTDGIGKVTLGIGNGTVINGDFTSINWMNGSYNIDVELDYGNGYQLFGNVDLQSVFYALNARHAEITDSIRGVNLNNISDNQQLFLNGTQISIEGGNTIDLAGIIPHRRNR